MKNIHRRPGVVCPGMNQRTVRLERNVCRNGPGCRLSKRTRISVGTVKTDTAALHRSMISRCRNADAAIFVPTVELSGARASVGALHFIPQACAAVSCQASFTTSTLRKSGSAHTSRSRRAHSDKKKPYQRGCPISRDAPVDPNPRGSRTAEARAAPDPVEKLVMFASLPTHALPAGDA